MKRELDDDDVWTTDQPTVGPATEHDAAPEDVAATEDAPPPRTRWFALKAGLIGIVLGAIVIAATAKSLENVAPSSPATTTTTAAPTTSAPVDAPVVAAEVTVPLSEPGAWPAQLDGPPTSAPTLGAATDALDGDVGPGLYLWADFSGWHLRLVNGDGVAGQAVAGVMGTINSDLPLDAALSSNPTSGTITVDGTAVAFDLSADVAVAGIDFSPAFFSENVVLVFDDATPVVPEQIRLGRDEQAPESVPLVLQKSPAS